MASDGRLGVTFVGINYAPEPTGIAPYTTGMAQALAERGHDVRAVTGYPHYPWWRVTDGFSGRRMTEYVSGVRVERRRHYVPQGGSTARRAMMEVDFGWRSIATGWSRPDVVVVVSPALIAARMAVTRARCVGLPVVTWVQDIYTLGVIETGGSATQQRAVRALERSLLQASDRVVVIHDRFRDRLQADMNITTPVDVVRNWSHVDPPATTRRAETRRRCGWRDDEVVVLHAGNMGAKQGLENVVDAARLAVTDGSRVRFVLLGSGNQRAGLEARDPSPALQFIDPLPNGEFEEALGAADVLLVNELPGLTEMSVPSKLTTYFATGLPVLAAVGSGSTTAEEVASSGGGLVVPAGDPAALVREALRLGQDRELSQALGSAGQAFREANLSREASVRRFEQTLLEAAGR